MSGIAVDISVLEVPPIDEWQAGLQRAVVAALPSVGEALVESVIGNFDRQADPWGTPWSALADSTLEAVARAAAGPTRVRRNFIGPANRGERVTRDRSWTRRRSERASEAVFGKKILIDTGILRGSVHWAIEADESGNVRVYIRAGGAAAAYAYVHQFGSEDGHTPARPYLPIRGTAESPIVDLPPELDAEVHGIFQAAIDAFAAEQTRAGGTR